MVGSGNRNSEDRATVHDVNELNGSVWSRVSAELARTTGGMGE